MQSKKRRPSLNERESADSREIFNDGTLKATLLPSNWVWVEWLNNTLGYLSKTVVKDLRYIEDVCLHNKHEGWLLGSERENTVMHGLIEKFGGQYIGYSEDGYKLFAKEVTGNV